MTEERQIPKPLLSGIIYGEIAYWITLVGMCVSIVGIVLYLIGFNQFFDPQAVLNGLFAGQDTAEIWKNAANTEVIHGHWYMDVLAKSDAIAMLGIGICCLAGVVGAWGSVIGMIVNKEKPYIFLLFAFIIAVILVMSAGGLISIH
ncbi:MAG: DUF1634 domain-containing protein [Thermodesulfobacteriota bacterium]